MKTQQRKRGPNIWVVRHKGRYTIKVERSNLYLIPPLPQRIAIGIARLIARANGSELIVQGEHGKIRARDSHGADAFPPRG